MKFFVKKTILLFSLFLFGGFGFAQDATNQTFTFQCGTDKIEGQIQSTDPNNITLNATIMRNGNLIEKISPTWNEKTGYSIIIDYASMDEGYYYITLGASLTSSSDSWIYESYIDNSGCDGGVKKRVKTYANEALDYFKNEQKVLTLPTTFIKSGILDFIDDAIAGTKQRFALSSSATYHDVPEWTLDPKSNVYPNFKDWYGLLPEQYKDAAGYIHFKGILIPILIPEGENLSEEHLLSMLNHGALLAPETNSLNDLGTIKMIYSHSLSHVKSPFSGVGAYLSVFSQVGDEITVYVKQGLVSYDKRTYTINHKLQIDPRGTESLRAFKKDGGDFFALITCKDGDVLGSTNGREVIVMERVIAEMGEFQRALVQIHDAPNMEAARLKINAYVKRKDLDEEDIIRMVKKMEEVEKNTGSPLAVIATYGKYMAAYDSVYN